jgi:gamma-glutamylputrescine oxidase
MSEAESSGLRWGDPPWNRSETPTRPLENSAADVVVIGGGLTGVSAAYHLARLGVRTVLLEARRLGDGASGRSGGIVLEGTAVGILAGAGECVPTLEKLVAEERIDCELRLQGCWEIEHQPGTGSDALPWKDDGHPLRIVRTVVGGTLDPAALLVGLARAAVRAGAHIHEGARVKRLVVRERPEVELDGAVLRPSFAIVALNAWTSSLLPDIRTVRSALTFACATEPLDREVLQEIGLGAGMPFYTLDLPYLWGREFATRRLIFGAGLAFASPPEFERLEIESGEAGDIQIRLESRVRGLHPALKQIRLSKRWAGPVAFSDDRVPLLGTLANAKTVFVAGAYAGHGVALGIWAGKALAQAIAEGKPLPSWGRLA